MIAAFKVTRHLNLQAEISWLIINENSKRLKKENQHQALSLVKTFLPRHKNQILRFFVNHSHREFGSFMKSFAFPVIFFWNQTKNRLNYFKDINVNCMFDKLRCFHKYLLRHGNELLLLRLIKRKIYLIVILTKKVY